MIAIAKGKLRNKGDESFFHNGKLYKFEKNDPTLFFMQRLRDEAHRFAITSHRIKRQKGIRKSLLDQIEGIGTVRKRALLNHFGSARAVESASFDEIRSVEGVEEKVAKKIYNFFSRMKIKIPNYLTIGRIIIVPVFVVTFYLPGFYGDIIPFVIFLIASFTDFLDGLLARMFKEESELGELLDPIADKIIVATALLLLVMNSTIKNYEVIAAIIILTREILVSGLREFLAKGKIKLPVSNLAKLKTFLQMFAIAILLTGETGNKILNFQDYNAQTIGIILLWLSAFLTLYTGYEYLRKGIDYAISEDQKN